MALDFNTTISVTNTYLVGEWAWVMVDVPETYSQQFVDRQQGGFVDVVQPILRGKLAGFDKAVLSLACRLEYVDWNVGTFRETGGNISEDLWAVVPSISFRPAPQTVIRLTYRHMQQQDILGNPPAKIGRSAVWVVKLFLNSILIHG